MPILVAAWVRLRPLAWPAAGTISLLALANVLVVDDAARQRTPAAVRLVQLVAIYLWIRAAWVWYWPMQDRRRPRKERRRLKRFRPGRPKRHDYSDMMAR
jgi:hypothetical protein